MVGGKTSEAAARTHRDQQVAHDKSFRPLFAMTTAAARESSISCVVRGTLEERRTSDWRLRNESSIGPDYEYFFTGGRIIAGRRDCLGVGSC